MASTLKYEHVACLTGRYVMADVSGANFNPAVSVGLLLGKRISVERFFIYVMAQVPVTPCTIEQTRGIRILQDFISEL